MYVYLMVLGKFVADTLSVMLYCNIYFTWKYFVFYVSQLYIII